MKFIYNQKVKIIDGFYEGQTAIVLDYKKDWFQYYYKIKTEEFLWSIIWIKESFLKEINAGDLK